MERDIASADVAAARAKPATAAGGVRGENHHPPCPQMCILAFRPLLSVGRHPREWRWHGNLVELHWARNAADVCFGSKADIPQRNCDVRFVPKADSCTAAILLLSINPVGMAEQRKRYVLSALAVFRKRFLSTKTSSLLRCND